MIYDNHYLEKDDIKILHDFHKSQGFVRFHYTRLYYQPWPDNYGRRYVYSYYTPVAFLLDARHEILVRKDYNKFSRTTTHNVNRFLREHDLYKVIYVDELPN